MNEEPTAVVADVQRVIYTIEVCHDWVTNDCPRRGQLEEFTTEVQVRRGWLTELPHNAYRCALCNTLLTCWVKSREVIT